MGRGGPPEAASGPQAASRPQALWLPHAPRVGTLGYDWEEAVRRVAPVLESGLKSAASGAPVPRRLCLEGAAADLGGLVGGLTDGLAVSADREGLFWGLWGVIFASKGGLCCMAQALFISCCLNKQQLKITE